MFTKIVATDLLQLCAAHRPRLRATALAVAVGTIFCAPASADEMPRDARWFVDLIRDNNGKSFCILETEKMADVAGAVKRLADSHHLGDAVTTPQTIQILAEAYPCSKSANARNVEVPPKGEFAAIVTKPTIDIMRTLVGTKGIENDSLIVKIKANAGDYQPPVFFALAQLLFKRGEVDDAIFWFNAGRLRGNFDALRCADVSARGAISVLISQMPDDLRKAQFADIGRLKNTVANVVQWDEATPHNYDQRWINLHGMGAMRKGLGDVTQNDEPLSLPKESWDTLAKQSREDFRQGFEKAITELKK
jgi:hypothetical protein